MDFGVGELHTVMNIVDRTYVKLFQVAKFLDLTLVQDGFVTSETSKSYDLYATTKANYNASHTAQNKRLLKHAFDAPIDTQGPYESKLFDLLHVIKVIPNNERCGKLIGTQCYALLAYPEIVDLFKVTTFNTKNEGSIYIGSNIFVHHMKCYIDLRRKEFSLTCLNRNLCAHEIGEICILMGSAMRLEATLYPSKVPLDSSHIRIHLLHQLMSNRQSPASDRTVERYNQSVIRTNERFKRIQNDTTRLKGILNHFKILSVAKRVKPKYTRKRKRIEFEETAATQFKTDLKKTAKLKTISGRKIDTVSPRKRVQNSKPTNTPNRY